MELMLDKNYTRACAWFLIALIFSCSRPEVKIRHYSYNNNIFSRIDDDKKTYLYYGYSADPNAVKKNSNLVIDWQFDDFLKASMIFVGNGEIEVVSGGGGTLYRVGNNKLLYFKEYTSRQFTARMQEFSGPAGNKNSIDLSDNLNFEETLNKKQKSEIKIIDN